MDVEPTRKKSSLSIVPMVRITALVKRFLYFSRQLRGLKQINTILSTKDPTKIRS